MESSSTFNSERDQFSFISHGSIMTTTALSYNTTTVNIDRLLNSEIEISKEYALFQGIGFLNNSNLPIEKFISASTKILDILCRKYKNHPDYYLLWTRYFDVLNKLKTNYLGSPETEHKFKEFNTSLVEKNGLLQAQIDWRILKKILRLKNKILINDGKADEKLLHNSLLLEFSSQINLALEFLEYETQPTKLTFLAIKVLTQLYTLSKDENEESKTQLIYSIIYGRFQKSQLGLPYSLILGEDGGLFLLLNSFNVEDLLSDNEQITPEFLNDKIMTQPKNDSLSDSNKKGKIIIGRGAFGIVRFAVSLFFKTNITPGQLICVKKTDSFKKINANPKEIKPPAIETVTNSVLGDYFASSNEISKLIYSPKVFDMGLILDREYSKDFQRKGYLMMQLVPQNSGDKIFANTFYQDWNLYQRSYIEDVFQKTLDLLDRKIAMIDLKPHNTLYDVDNGSATIIDLGGSVYVEEGPENFDPSKYPSIQFTPEFTSDELKEYQIGKKLEGVNKKIDLTKSLAYSCGKILKFITNKAEKQNMDSTIKRVYGLLDEIAKRMTVHNPQERLGIKEALKEIHNIGDAKNKELFVLRQYISKIKNRILNNRSSISLNEDILEIEKILIPPLVSEQDPDVYKNTVNARDLTKELEIKFFNSQPADHVQGESLLHSKNADILLLLGDAGSGKSIFLQLQFIKAVNDWDDTKPIPIYFNLANEVNLNSILEKLDFQLNTNLKKNLFGKDLHLFIDSFDEGLFSEEKEHKNNRENLIQSYLKKLLNLDEKSVSKTSSSKPKQSIKILISCRSSYFTNTPEEEYEKWFRPNLSNNNQNKTSIFINFSKLFIVPINLRASTEDSVFKQFIDNYLKNIQIIHKEQQESLESSDYYFNMIHQLNLKEHISTGFLFDMLMKTLPKLVAFVKLAPQLIKISKADIYREFVISYIQKGVANNLTPEKIRKILNSTIPKEKIELLVQTKIQEEKKSEDEAIIIVMNEWLNKIGQIIAVALHIKEGFRLKKSDKIFDIFGFTDTNNTNNIFIPFKNQKVYHILKNLPLKLEIKKVKEQRNEKDFNPEKEIFVKSNFEDLEKEDEEIAVGFIHDTIKNYYLLEALKEEAIIYYNNKFSKIDTLNIANSLPESLSRILCSRYITDDIVLIKFIATEIQIKHYPETLTNYLLHQIELSKSSKPINDFEEEEVENSEIEKRIISASNCITILVAAKYNFSGREFHNQRIRNANISNGIFPNCIFNNVDLSFTNMTNCKLSMSKFTGCNLSNLTLSIFPDFLGHRNFVRCIAYSPDGKLLASGSTGKSIKIWNTDMGKCIQSLKSHLDPIAGLAFSPDGRTLAGASEDKTISIWDLSSFKLLKSLEGHTAAVTCVAYSPNGKNIASGSGDKLIKIWEVGCIATLEGHTEQVTTLAYSIDGEYLASGSVDLTIRIWNLNLFSCIQILYGHSANVNCVIFSLDGKYMASGSSDKTIRIWDSKSFNCLQTLDAHASYVNCLAYSPDSKYLVSASYDTTIKIWDAMSSTCLQTLEGHTYNVNGLSYSPDGKHFASASSDMTIKIWDAKSVSCLQNLEGHPSYVNKLAFSPDCKYLASCAFDKTIKIWDPISATCLKTLEGHSHDCRCIAFSPDGKSLASGSEDKTIKIWDIKSSTCLKTLCGHSSFIRCLAYSPDQKYLASSSADKTIILWDVVTSSLLKILTGHADYVRGILFLPGTTNLVSCSSDKSIKIWDLTTESCINTLETQHTYNINGISLSPDGLSLASASSDKMIKIWDTKTWNCLKTLKGHGKEVNCISYSSDGKYLASGSSDKTIKIWDANSGICLQTLDGHSYVINSVIFSSDGKMMASASSDKSIKIWNANSINYLRAAENFAKNSPVLSPDGRYRVQRTSDNKLEIWDNTSNCGYETKEGHDDVINSLAYSPDSKCIASGSSDNSIILWDTTSTSKLQTFTGHSKRVNHVVFSPDGLYLASASADCTIKIWEIQSGKCLETLKGHTKEVKIVIYSPDGKNLASVSSDKSIKIWDEYSSNCLQTIKGHKDEVTSILYSPNSRYIASASDDLCCRIWNSKNGKLLQTVAHKSPKEVFSSVLNQSPSLLNELSIYESKLKVTGSIIEDSKISNQTLRILQQRGTLIDPEYNVVYDEIEKESYNKTIFHQEIKTELWNNFIQSLENEYNHNQQFNDETENEKKVKTQQINLKTDNLQDPFPKQTLLVKQSKCCSIF